MAIKRVIVEIDMDSIGFAALSRAASAISALEEIAEKDQSIAIKSSVSQAIRKKRADSLEEGDLKIPPGAAKVLAHLASSGGAETPHQIAAATRIKTNSVRAYLHKLLRRGIVQQIAVPPNGSVGRSPVKWAATENAGG